MEATQSDALILDGIAELALQGLAPARAYQALAEWTCVRPWADVAAAASGAGLRSQILFGERFDVLAETETQAFGRCRRDGAIGWVARTALSALTPAPTHRVSAGFAEARGAPALSSAPTSILPMNALVAVVAEEGDFARLSGDGWVGRRDLADLQSFATDPAAVAELRIGSAVLAGGRGLDGLDGPGLIQEAFYACGLACARAVDTLALMGEPSVEPKRSDLVIWDQGCGLLLDAERLVSADLRSETVGVETLSSLRRQGLAPVVRTLIRF